VLVFREPVVVLKMADARNREVIKTIFKPLDHVNMFIVNLPTLQMGLIELPPKSMSEIFPRHRLTVKDITLMRPSMWNVCHSPNLGQTYHGGICHC
jgi:hypothetical protein